MSTSMSLTLSEDQDSKTSKSFSDLRKFTTSNGHVHESDGARKLDDLYERRHTGLGIGSLREHPSIILTTGKLKRWDEQNVGLDGRARLPSDADEGAKSDGFYLEVDEKMSRNSCEYPEQQSKYIEQWLDASTPFRSRSFGGDSAQVSGNVVGIRGFSSESFISNDRQFRADYNKLRRDYAKLEAEYKQLRNQAAGNRKGRGTRRTGDDLQHLRAMVMKQSEQLDCMAASQQGAMSRICDRCRGAAANINKVDDNLERMRFAKNQFALKLAQQEQDHAAAVQRLSRQIEQMTTTIRERDDELVALKMQVKNLSLEPSNRKLLALSSENVRLKESGDLEKLEHLALRDNYMRLEQKLRALISDQKSLNQEQHDEVKEILLELCRLQVHLPKLEMILDTETQIKLQLQSQLSSQQEKNEKLNDQIESLRRALNESLLRARSKDSCDVERFRNEISLWQEKYDRLKREHSDLSEVLRAAKSKLAQQDTRYQNELQRARDLCQQELDRTRADQRQLETESAALRVELSRAISELRRCESERDRSNGDLLLAHRKLEEISSGKLIGESQMEAMSNKLLESERTISQLRLELSSVSLEKKKLAAQVEMTVGKLDQSRKQYNELKGRFEVQQKLFEELRERRDREVAKLRLDLNLEQYNRQVSLKGIERELRSSLRELEAMKCRFSKRLTATNNSPANLTSSSNTPSSSACKRTVKFEGPSTKVPTISEQTSATVTMQSRPEVAQPTHSIVGA